MIFRPLTGGIERVPASGSTVREVIADLERQYPSTKGYVIDEAGFRPEVFVAVNDEEAFGLDTPVPDGAEVHILPAIAGG
jgi:molybdopterin converting factor small subunit